MGFFDLKRQLHIGSPVLLLSTIADQRAGIILCGHVVTMTFAATPVHEG
jgi:hypothetical protein